MTDDDAFITRPEVVAAAQAVMDTWIAKTARATRFTVASVWVIGFNEIGVCGTAPGQLSQFFGPDAMAIVKLIEGRGARAPNIDRKRALETGALQYVRNFRAGVMTPEALTELLTVIEDERTALRSLHAAVVAQREAVKAARSDAIEGAERAVTEALAAVAEARGEKAKA